MFYLISIIFLSQLQMFLILFLTFLAYFFLAQQFHMTQVLTCFWSNYAAYFGSPFFLNPSSTVTLTIYGSLSIICLGPLANTPSFGPRLSCRSTHVLFSLAQLHYTGCLHFFTFSSTTDPINTIPYFPVAHLLLLAQLQFLLKWSLEPNMEFSSPKLYLIYIFLPLQLFYHYPLISFVLLMILTKN